MVRHPRPARPLPPPATDWTFPDPRRLPPDEDLIAVGADLEPGTLLTAYVNGYFPMPVSRSKVGWFHPDPRGVLPVADLRISRSLRRSTRRFTVTVDEAFDQVIRACADPARPMGWINSRVVRAYSRLHVMGWAHSVEVWDDDGLAGGLYGIAIGGFFAGESMFHRRTDASKVALLHLVDLLGSGADTLLDVQWVTPHLASLGAVEVSRPDYLERLRRAVQAPLPPDLFP
ncbi:MAG: leucyl/phenylalanyl-tRNA--protein transferase [Acidimicrobiales bacterium]